MRWQGLGLDSVRDEAAALITLHRISSDRSVREFHDKPVVFRIFIGSIGSGIARKLFRPGARSPPRRVAQPVQRRPSRLSKSAPSQSFTISAPPGSKTHTRRSTAQSSPRTNWHIRSQRRRSSVISLNSTARELSAIRGCQLPTCLRRNRQGSSDFQSDDLPSILAAGVLVTRGPFLGVGHTSSLFCRNRDPGSLSSASDTHQLAEQ
jgi:hypothetical protein